MSAAIRLTGGVMAHPRRLGPGRELLATTPPGLLELVLDPQPDGPPTGLRTAMRAWSSIPAGSTHHVVLEDDALLVPGFAEHAVRAATGAPDAAVVFHANWCSRTGAAVRLGALAGARWVRAAREYTPTVALMLPAAVGAGFAAFARQHAGDWAGDVVMARYLAARGVRTYVTVPNLVEHGDFPSVAENDAHGLRLSACYGEPPPGADWSITGAVEPAALPFYKFGLALCAVRGDAGRWSTVGPQRWARRLGVDVDDCATTFAAALARSAVLRERFDDDVLLGVWRTAYATGAVGRRPGQDVSALAADPLVVRAAQSIGPGGLCLSVGGHELLALRQPLGELALAGVVAGLRAPAGVRPAAGRRAGGRHRRVVVVPCAPPVAPSLGQALAGELADRGHDVTVVAADDAVRVTGTGPQPGTVTLRTGTPYGPGVPCQPLDDYVARSLVAQPIVVDRDCRATSYSHVWDIAAEVARALDGTPVDPPDAGSLVDPAELAVLVSRTVKPVPVLDGDTPLTAPPGTAGRDGPGIRLTDGIRTVGQWLAYEADGWR
ncbi:hypothetical protein [Micromonospora sp. RTGN7]|uniref:hypothetical protein n=1 Tax=Micromonospora sp. RTGN7 TaxID=3016526 RepID=UPI0029FF0A9D|nr:hypothetical protein [Micromonospora sp. RTGN7]